MISDIFECMISLDFRMISQYSIIFRIIPECKNTLTLDFTKLPFGEKHKK